MLRQYVERVLLQQEAWQTNNHITIKFTKMKKLFFAIVAGFIPGTGSNNWRICPVLKF
jgi:hypothetical protein